MTRADEYRAHAAECGRQAALAINPKVKKQLQDVATQWRQLAETAEYLDRDRR